jgi:hypothetical protein
LRLVLVLILATAGCTERTPQQPPQASAAPALSIPPVVAPPADAGDADADASPPAGTGICHFVARPPARVRDLAAALRVPVPLLYVDPTTSGMGSISIPSNLVDGGRRTVNDDVTRLWLTYAWDPYHQSQVGSVNALAGKELRSYVLHFAGKRAECVAMLGRAYGAAQPKTRPADETSPRPARYEKYGPFYVAEGAGEPFTLEWYAREPDWSKPAADPAARRRALADLAALARGGATQEKIAAAIAAAPAGAGITDRGAPNRTDPSLELEPPVPATELADAMGLRGAIGESNDVHMSHWHLAVLAEGKPGAPRLGPWELDATLGARPTGGKVPGLEPSPIAHAALGPRDVVRNLRFVVPAPR